MRQFAEYHDKTAQREYDKALQTLREERAQAIKDGDGVAFDKADGKIEDLKKEVQDKTQKAKKETGETPEFNEWLSRNRWAEDPKLQIIGRGIAEAMVEDGEKASGTELLDLVTKEMKQRYPEKFENPRRTAAAAVEGGGAPRKSGGKTYSDLPAEARAACDRMAKNGYSGDAKAAAEFKAQYVKNFFEEA